MTRIPPFLIVAITGALAFLSVMQVRFSSDLYELLPQDLPEVRGMEQINRFFSRHGQLMVTVQGEQAWAVEEAGVSLANRLRDRPALVSEVFQELSIEQLVSQGGELLAWTWLNSRPEVLAGLAERLAPERSRATIVESLAVVQDALSTERALLTSYDPLGLARLDGGAGEGGAAEFDPMRSEDGTFEVLYVEGRGADFSDYRAAKKWLAGIQEVVREWETEWMEGRGVEEKVRIGLTGTPAFMAEVGTEMERDMTVSVVATLVLISILFYVMHRQLRPLSWLLAAMFSILAVTLHIGGLLYGDLSVMSVGFAAILMGLAVDYGIVLYRDAIESGDTARGVRRSVGPGIAWAAATTAVVFLSLNFSSMPGLAEMGNLVAIGVLVGALVMLFLFAPVAAGFQAGRVAGDPVPSEGPRSVGRGPVLVALLVPLLAVGSVMVGGKLELEPNFHPFRIKESPSMKAWNEVQDKLRGRGQAMPTIVTGESLTALHARLAEVEDRVARAQEDGLIHRALLPTDWIPSPDHQQQNAETLREILAGRGRLLAEIDEVGFSVQGASLADVVFSAWEDFVEGLESKEVVLPGGSLAAWSIGRVFREDGGTVAALAAVTPVAPRDRAWVEFICDDSTNVASLHSMGTALNEGIHEDLLRVFLPMSGLLVLMLAIVYRSWRDLLLSLFCLVFAGAALVILTLWTPFTWNSFNVFGLPLLFGTGLDFSIHMIFALRRVGGDVRQARRSMGRALIFCGTSSAIGFGSLATASAHGLSSLGIACAAGILINMCVAVWLLPHWFQILHRRLD